MQLDKVKPFLKSFGWFALALFFGNGVYAIGKYLDHDTTASLFSIAALWLFMGYLKKEVEKNENA